MSTQPYFTVNNPTDPLAVANRTARHATYHAWKHCFEVVGPIDASSRDWDEHLATLTKAIGTSTRRIEQHVIAFTILARLPRLQGLVEEMMHIETYVLTRIADVLVKIDPALDADETAWALIDEELTDYLTPTKPAQVLPSPENIVRKLTRVLLSLQEEIPTPVTLRLSPIMGIVAGPGMAICPCLFT